jgi:two-component system chemotaxis response regulator CheB
VARRDLICVGTSAGGVPALSTLVKNLPGDLPAALLVVLHVAPDHLSVLPRILSSSGKLPAEHARNGEPLLSGRIYVAPPDMHLMVDRGVVRTSRGARENGHRPAIDTLFRTAAYAYGPRVIGMILTGALDDGVAGLLAIKQRGGLALVQDPADAFCPDMPRHALEVVDADHVLPIGELSAILPELVGANVPEATAAPEPLASEARIALERRAIPPPGQPSSLACPACGGVLNEVQDHRMLRFRCRVGHAYAPESLYGSQQLGVEAALWAALRALEEQTALSRRLAVRARDGRHGKSATRHEERAAGAEKQAELIRRALRVDGPGDD